METDNSYIRIKLEVISVLILCAIRSIMDSDPEKDSIAGRYLVGLAEVQAAFEKEMYPDLGKKNGK